MPMGPSGSRWCRLLLIVLLVLPIPAALGMYDADGWMAASDPAESDESWLRVAAAALSDSAWTQPAPPPAGRACWPDPLDVVVAGWTCLTPTDRAPPRA
ncbi:MAG TPA: hypothetical protein VKA83_15630 [Methylomirabilota bacterium]|jgi:hypothetical protein|nr:hypothetical protein [Methylomirabilota bacterium]